MASLEKKEKKTFESLFKEDKVIGGAVRVYQGKNNKWSYGDVYGIIISYQRDFTLFIGVYNFDTHSCMFEHELYDNFDMVPLGKNFVCFEADKVHFGFLFAFEAEVPPFMKDTKKLKAKKPGFFSKKKKSNFVIGDASSFSKNIGFSGGNESMDGSINPGIVQIFKRLGVKKKDILADPEVFQYLLKISSEYSSDADLPTDVLNNLVTMVERIINSLHARRAARPSKPKTASASGSRPPNQHSGPAPPKREGHGQANRSSILNGPAPPNPHTHGRGPPPPPTSKDPPPLPPRVVSHAGSDDLNSGGEGDVPPPPAFGGGDVPPPPPLGGGDVPPPPPLGGGGDVPPPPPLMGGGDVPPPPPLISSGGDVPPPPPLGAGGDSGDAPSITNRPALRATPAQPKPPLAPTPSSNNLLGGIMNFDMSKLKKTEKKEKEPYVPENKMAAQLMAVLQSRRTAIQPDDEDEGSDDDDW